MIKNFKLFESHENIHDICEKYAIKNFVINDDNSIDVNVSVYLKSKSLEKILLKFRNINGNFDLSNNNLSSLNRSPIRVNGYFDCAQNRLTTLKYCPKNISSNFYCEYNQIRSLEGFPENIGENFFCEGNPIYSIVGGWINRRKRHSMVEYFNDLDILRNNCTTIILDRLKEFQDIYNVHINLKIAKKHYHIID